MSSPTYKLVIGCNLNQFRDNTFEPNIYLELDIQKERNITASSKIASYPMQNGNTMSDHMYRDPSTYSVSGSFALRGKNSNLNDNREKIPNFIYSYLLDEIDALSEDRLGNIEKVFEYIKDNGILCTLTTLNEEDGSSTRFKIRKNMALNSIQWVEGLDKVDYTFSFQEIILVNDETSNVSEDELKYYNLPYVSYPSGSSLGEVLQNLDVLDDVILSSLYENDYIDPEWLKEIKKQQNEIVRESSKTGNLIAWVSGSLGAAAIAGGIVLIGYGVAAGASLIFPVGTVLALTSIIAVGIVHIIKKNARETKKEAKTKHKYLIKLNDKLTNKTEEGLNILMKLIDDVKSQVKLLDFDVNVYSFEEPKEGILSTQSLVKVDDKIFVITANKNNITTGKYIRWDFSVVDSQGNYPDLNLDPILPVGSLDDMIPTNIWFRYKDYEIYLINPSLYYDGNDLIVKDEDGDDISGSEVVSSKLSSYALFISNGSMKEKVKNIYNSISDIIYNLGTKKDGD